MKQTKLFKSALTGIMIFALCCWATLIALAQTQPCPTVGRCFPPPNSQYTGGPTFQLYPIPGGTAQINFDKVLINQFTQCMPPPGGIGGTVVILTGAHVKGTIFGLPIPPNFDANGQLTIKMDKTGQLGMSEFFDTEMLQLNIFGGTLPPAVMIRESPTKQSLGKVTITSVPGGFTINSFFDVFTELSTDAGATWTPATQSGKITLSIPPPNCDDGNPCTDDFLDAQCICHHVDHTPTTCDDNNPCTDDFLNANCQCEHKNHQPTTCNDNDPCTDDFLDANCVCQHVSHKPETCDDGNPCTEDFLGTDCVCRHIPPNCDDGDPCTKDYADANCGCHHDPVCPVSTDPCTEIVCEDGVCVSHDLRPTVNPSSNSSVCLGGTLTLFSNVSGGGCLSYNFQWTGPNSFSSTAKDPTRPGMTAADAGTYTVTVSCDENNCSVTKSTEVFVVPCPVVCQYVPKSVPPACTGECPPVYYKDGTEAGKADCQVYKVEKYNRKGQLIQRGECRCNHKFVLYSNTCAFNGDGKDCKGECTPLYRSKDDAANDRNRIEGHCRQVKTAAAATCGCVYDVKPKRLSGEMQDEEEINMSQALEMFPNPTSQEINVVVEDFVGKTALHIINILGEEVFLRDVELKGESIYSIDVNALAPGIYKVILMNNNELSTGTFIKE